MEHCKEINNKGNRHFFIVNNGSCKNENKNFERDLKLMKEKTHRDSWTRQII